jgi:exonuclease VII large subunit
LEVLHMSGHQGEELLADVDRDAAAFDAEWQKSTSEFAADLQNERARLDEAERSGEGPPQLISHARAELDKAESRFYRQAEQARRRFETAAEEVRRRVRAAAPE